MIVRVTTALQLDWTLVIAMSVSDDDEKVMRNEKEVFVFQRYYKI